MLFVIFGESCTGKSTLAELLKERLGAETATGKDYLRAAKNEAEAKKNFSEKLKAAVSGANIVYVITDKEDLALLPAGAYKVLATASLETIKERFSKRMHGNLPAPIAAMLERKHGAFDNEPCDYEYHSDIEAAADACDKICARL